MTVVEVADEQLFETPCTYLNVSGRYVWECVAPMGHVKGEHYFVQVSERARAYPH